MKNVLTVILLLGAIAVGAQTPQARASRLLNEMYPDAEESYWIESSNGFNVDIEQDEEAVQVVFDADGEWVKSLTEIPLGELPAAVLSTCQNEHLDGEPYKAWLVSSDQGEEYQVDVEEEDSRYRLLITTSGKLISSTNLTGDDYVQDDDDIH